MKRYWRWLLARFHLSDAAVCELSAGRGLYDDYHDYLDSEQPFPWHFYVHRCRRCGKEFMI